MLCESHCVEAALCSQVQSKGEELQSTRSQLSMMEADLHAAEKERDGLAKKVEMLERALESPGSKVALRRILER
jgi:coenzyme F420-reducing hydrogenase beta subunit